MYQQTKDLRILGRRNGFTSTGEPQLGRVVFRIAGGTSSAKRALPDRDIFLASHLRTAQNPTKSRASIRQNPDPMIFV
jgi:hypothetical protein